MVKPKDINQDDVLDEDDLDDDENDGYYEEEDKEMLE